MITEITYSELETKYPNAYKALPDPYKEDSCLKFFMDVNGHICAEDDFGNEYLFIDLTLDWIKI